MIDRKNIRKAVLPPSGRLLRGILLGIGAVVVIAAACLIPLFSESSSQIVKTELDKWLVIVGKICGMTAGALLVLQFALSARFRWLDRIYGLNRLFHIHRFCGFCTAILASFHPMLIFAPKAMTTGAIRLDLWPELLGAVILILLWGIVGVGIWRVFLNFSFDRWWLSHRLGVFVVIVFLAVHSYMVSEDFHNGWPRYAFFAAVVIYALMFLWVKVIKPMILRGEAFRVTDISLAGKDAYDIECTPEEGHVFAFTPGQFAFVTFNSRQLSAEEHPFTISSAPTNKKNLHFTIRCSGDFTSNVGQLKKGDTAFIDGPYGLFSHLALVSDPKRELIMIAGGVGITPMLSMLRYMVDMNDGRRVTLVWSNRTVEDIVFRDEFQKMENRLKGLKVFHILTRRSDHTSESGRLDESKLRNLLVDCSRKAMVFICGPPKMMESVDAAIRRIGFPKRSIKMERFAL